MQFTQQLRPLLRWICGDHDLARLAGPTKVDEKPRRRQTTPPKTAFTLALLIAAAAAAAVA